MATGADPASLEITTEELDSILTSYAGERGALIPILQDLQERIGHLPKPLLREIGERLKIPYSEVAGVVSFYSFFSTVPRGKHTIRTCLGTACYVRGGKELLGALEKQLGISVGDTTGDRQFSLEVGRCFGACGLAPVVVVDDDVHQRVKPAKVGELLAQYKEAEDEE
ncbi:MAG: NAD(P)H-dependent oxidoreductase subunit E [Alkalispirochaetaceae bacterium]